jgi:glutathione S-transferase
MVESFVTENNISVSYKNTLESDIKQELINIWGKWQVPFLKDKEKDIQMYESQDIMNYLEENYI